MRAIPGTGIVTMFESFRFFNIIAYERNATHRNNLSCITVEYLRKLTDEWYKISVEKE